MGRVRPKNGAAFADESAAPRGETNMSDAFHDRENNFEKTFANDEALWVAELKGVTGDDADKFAERFVGTHVGTSDDDVIAALKNDLARNDIDISDHRLHKRMGEEMAAALVSVRAGK
jgi:hypothetical protein